MEDGAFRNDQGRKPARPRSYRRVIRVLDLQAVAGPRRLPGGSAAGVAIELNSAIAEAGPHPIEKANACIVRLRIENFSLFIL
jgi:hypothetical protein